MAEGPDDARLLHLALAAADAPVSVEALAGSGLWTAASLWVLCEDARQAGLVSTAGRGLLRWSASRERGRALAAASAEDFAALLGRAPFPELLLDGARAAAAAHDFPRAERIYRALVSAPARGLFPGGETGWMAAVVEAARLFRSGWPLPPAALEAALAVAAGQGDHRARAVLLAARGMGWLMTDPARAQAVLAEASEAAESTGDADLGAEVRTYTAIALVLAGRLREGIAAFEAALGDLPAEAALTLDLDGPSPASALGLLAFAYVGVGERPRAVDLLERLRHRGAELGNDALEAHGGLFLALAHMMAGDVEAARPHLPATARLGEGTPASRWYPTLVQAWVRAADGDPAGARALLAPVAAACPVAERPWAGGSQTWLLLERLELDVDAEVARHVEAPRPFFAGIAHRFQARRILARGGDPALAEASFARSEELLREAGAPAERALCLTDTADLLGRLGRSAEEAARRAEAQQIAPTARPDPARLAAAFVELGRLGALAPRPDGLFGEVAARLCRDLGAERCVLCEVHAGAPTVLAFRGAAAWKDAVLALPAPVGVSFAPAIGSTQGQLLRVAFADEELGKSGLIALENRETPPLVGPAEAPLLAALGRQLGVLLAHAGLRKELGEARHRLALENRYQRPATPEAPPGSGRIVGGSRALREVLELVRRVAPSPTPVLVTGETGTGKELVAREVHHLSPRRGGAFVAVHVASLPPGLVASALFGHERGAFTGATEQARGRFELADGGTLFLDEVGELAPEDQVRLLRVLQEGSFERVGGARPLRSDFRLVAATHRDLGAAVRQGRFREDLYFRLAAFPVHVPPLRERREEIPTLALHFLEQVSRRLGLGFDGITEGDMARLVAHRWPGNVRELAHVVERAALLSDPPRLQVPPLDDEAEGAAPPSREEEEWPTLEESDRRYIRRVLEHVRGRINGPGGAADVLAVKPSTLQFWIDKLGLREDLARARLKPPSPPRGAG